MRNVLVVESQASAAEAIGRDLRRQGYATRIVDSGAAALSQYRNADLVLLSLELPDTDGLQVCQSVRAESDIPLIAFTHSDQEIERVLALKSGADDCVVRTWGTRELGARIEAVLRRAQPRSSVNSAIYLHPLRIDPRTRKVHLRDQVINVTSKEFELLYTLAKNPETVVSRKELMVKVWGISWSQGSRTIDTHVSSLRTKLGSNGWIITVRGVGYRMGHSDRVGGPLM